MFVKKGAEFMLFTFEDALQIHHAKCEKIEVYKLANPAEAWDRTAYEEKISKGPSALPDKAFPVLVIVRAEREG